MAAAWQLARHVNRTTLCRGFKLPALQNGSHMAKRRHIIRGRQRGNYYCRQIVSFFTFLNGLLVDAYMLLVDNWKVPSVMLTVVFVLATGYVLFTSAKVKVRIHQKPSRSSIGYKSSAENEDRTLSNLGHTSSSGRLSLISYKPLSEIEDRTGVSPGLYNLGNTCFMNSILQCLVYTEPLVDYFTNRDYIKDLKSPSNGNLTSAFHDFTSTMKNSDTSSSVRPYKLRSQVQKYAPRFSGDNQQDAQEFLRCLLQGLHDEVNRVKSRTTRRASSINDSFWSWRLYKDSDDSLITDLFAGQLQSTLKCTMCSHESITYDPFWDLSLPMPENRSNVSLRDCYSMFTSPEFLDGPDRPMCDRCQKKTRSSKQIEISIFPKILVIHLKRFSASRSGNHKIGMMVDCPLTLSSASDLASHNSFSDRCSYSLYGVVDHIGGKNAGHYVAKCRSPSMREWHEYSDARVTKATSVITCNSYILFYTQRNSG